MSELVDPQRPRDFLMGFAAGLLTGQDDHYADGPGWSSASELLRDMEELAQPLMDRWLLEGSDDFLPLIAAYHRKVLEAAWAANKARDAARAARAAETGGTA